MIENRSWFRLANASGRISDFKHSCHLHHSGRWYGWENKDWELIFRGTLSQFQKHISAYASLCRSQLILSGEAESQKRTSMSKNCFMSPESNFPLPPAKSKQELKASTLKKYIKYLPKLPVMEDVQPWSLVDWNILNKTRQCRPQRSAQACEGWGTWSPWCCSVRGDSQVSSLCCNYMTHKGTWLSKEINFTWKTSRTTNKPYTFEQKYYSCPSLQLFLLTTSLKRRVTDH